VIAAVLLGVFAGWGCKKQPLPVQANDEVQCCFLVSYEGLNGQTIQDKQCKADPVCAKSGDADAEDVCKPLACKAGDINPYGLPGPGGSSTTVGNCSVDNTNTTLTPQGCADSGGGAGTDQPPPPRPVPGEGSGADSSGT
jgi:hypothetical protein